MAIRWTTADFDALSWHDCHVHGMRLASANDDGTGELEFDIDFIVEWLPQGGDPIQFRIAPATLTFHDVSELHIELDFRTPTAAMDPFSLDRIERRPISYPTGYTSYRWRLPINWPAGEITFDSPGFTQELKRDPIITVSQWLTAAERRE